MPLASALEPKKNLLSFTKTQQESYVVNFLSLMATKKGHPAIVGRKTIFNLDYFFQRTDESSWSLPNHATRKNALDLKISSAKNRALHHKEFCLAEGVGFEPTIRYNRIPDFESGAFDLSATLPRKNGICRRERAAV